MSSVNLVHTRRDGCYISTGFSC